ncbi:tetratricopeptide repeat protein [Pseudooceanicola algae]|uniref:Uncharacterized protein n=1 Tax=Pseudooceanicola algae TaxID=1537215 RepID=A0A418SE84_9RHOB|nr:hypothetical protein [Pseudooceanicola algae]QPM89630.1 hypothetical protein PSAL_008520 [Pseudooceanicola algae]
MTYFDLGNHSFPVTTRSNEAQIWFDRGLVWTYGFHHEEALRCFRRATEADPGCAMAYWGIAYAAGPNYNFPWALRDQSVRETSLSEAYDAMLAALALVAHVTPVEAALIRALPARYPDRAPADDMAPWDTAFAEAMRRAYARHPDSPEITTFFVEAMMNRTPWQMWDLATGRPAEGADTLECRAVLEATLARPDGMKHPGLLHLFIHLMEMSPEPEAALPIGDALRQLCPDAGHLVHMPTHIDMLCGAYQDAVVWNQQAVKADLKWVARSKDADFYTGYRLHNYHFIIFGALFLGQIAPAMDALKGISDTTPEGLLQITSPPMADFFESYLAFEPHILIRFGRWRELIALDLPDDRQLYVTRTAFTLYGRALAHAALGEVPEALLAEAQFLDCLATFPESRLLGNNRVIDLLDIARAMLRGEILYRQADYEAAFSALREAVHLADTLPYDEPWGWMQPPRHALGALLLEQGRTDEAEQVFREDLGLAGALPRAAIHPDNVWALKGLHDCLDAKETSECADLPLIRQRLGLALARADVSVAASCFCAQAAMEVTCCGNS